MERGEEGREAWEGKKGMEMLGKGWKQVRGMIRAEEGRVIATGMRIKGSLPQRPLDVFLKVFSEAMIQTLMKGSGKQCFSRKKVMIWMGMRILLYARQGNIGSRGPSHILAKHISMLRQEILEELHLPTANRSSKIPGASQFIETMKLAILTPELMYRLYTSNMMEIVDAGRYVNVSHKYVSFSRTARVAIVSPHTPQQDGSWVTMVGGMMEGCGLPILVGMVVHDGGGGKGGWEKAEEILHWWRAHRGEQDPIWCVGQGLNEEGFRKYCKAHGVEFIGKVWRKQCVNLPYVLGKVQKEECVALQNVEEREMVLGYQQKWPEQRNYFLYTNVGGVIEGGALPSILATCGTTFVACKSFGKLLASSWWPYNRKGLGYQFDSFFFSTILLSTYHLWLSSQSEDSLLFSTPFSFYEQLGWDILKAFV